MPDIIMPKMSDSMEEGKVLRWIKSQGEQVEKGEPVAEIETDKANVELESPEAGVLGEIRVKEGEIVPIGATIAVISPAGEVVGAKVGTAAEAPPEEEKPAPPVEEKKEEEKPAPPKPDERPAPTPKPEAQPPAAEIPPAPEGVIASPLARKIARDAGVDLRGIRGTGPGGRIVEADVRGFIERGGRPAPAAPQAPTPPAPPAPAMPPTLDSGQIELGRIWQTVGRRMTESKREIPHFYVTMEADMEEALRMRESLNSVRPEDRQVSLNDIVVKACAVALVKHPMLNASYAGENKVQMHGSVHIGIAVAIPNGLITPVVRNCESKSLSTISDEARDLIRRTRSGEIRPEEYSGATFTVTNLGMYGVEEFLAIIVPGQSAILAIGAAELKPVVHEGRVEARNRMRLTLAADHRVTDGARAAEFLRDLKQVLEQPMSLLE